MEYNPMKTIRFLSLFMACLIIVSPFTASAADETKVLPSGIPYTGIADEIDGFLADHSDNHAAVAAAVFDAENDILTRYFGYTDAEGTVPLSEDSVLEWGSTSKLIVWVSAMQLVCGGRLDLNADVRTYLPDGFLKNLRFDRPVTMLHLMNHMAGFQETDFVLEVEREDQIIPLGEYLAKYQPLQVFEPGTVAAYSNWGAALAGYIVECISGMPFWQYAQENIFIPLGMTRSAISPDLHENAFVREKRTEFVSYDPDGSPAREETKVYILPYPAGMCTSTLEDFLTFARALLVRDERLLPPEGFDLLYTPSLYYTGTDLARICHGFLVDYDFPSPVIGHDGATAGGSSRLILDPDHGIGMVMLTNQRGGSLYRREMAEKVFGTADYHIDVDGYYVPARNVFTGKQKLIFNLFLINRCHITKEMTDGLFFNVTDDRLEISSTDYIVPRENYAFHDVMAVAWLVCTVLALLCFAVYAAIMIVRALKKRPPCKHGPINLVFSLLVGLAAVFADPSLPASAALVYYIALCLLFLAFAAYLVIQKRRQNDPSKRSAVGYFVFAGLTFCLAVAVWNAIIWDIVVIV